MALVKQIWLTALLLAVAVVVFGVCGTDIWVSKQLYNHETHRWIVDPNSALPKLIFYDGIKRLLIIVAVAMLVATIVWWKRPAFSSYRKGMVIVLLSSILVPLMVGSLKDVTNMPCPKNVEAFDGEYPSTCVWEKYPTALCHKEKQKCWPAGHASGGFALLAFVFLFHSRRAKIISVVVAMSVGWSMGTYKMLIGDHFLSHTVITMILAWLLILIIAQSVDKITQRLQKRDSVL